jgi:hypothetical protein
VVPIQGYVQEMTSMRTPKNFGGPATAVTSMTYDSAERVSA